MASYRKICEFLIPMLLGVSKVVHGFRSYTTEIDAIRFEHNTDIVNRMSVELIHEDGRNKLNGSFSFAQDFNDLHIFNWVILNRPNGKRPTLYNVSVSACKFLDNSAKNLNPIFATVLQLLKKYITGFPRKCPLQKNLEHLMKGIYFDEDMMPPYLPENNFTGVIGFMRANIMGFKVTLKARVESKFKGDNRRGKK